jgi:hypothetical protein
MDTTPDVIGLPWYEAESFQAVMALMDDPDRLFGTYAAWHTKAQSTEDFYRRSGIATVRVVLDTVNFPKWCNARPKGLRLDAKARIDYAAAIAAQQYRADR